jgi:hypothetical protein
MLSKGDVTISVVEASRIADVLYNTMSNSGYFDDWDEIVLDMKDDMSERDILDYAKSVQFSLVFLNTFDITGRPKIVKDFYEEAIEILKSPVE